MPALIMILRLIRAASYLFFSPAPGTEKGKVTGGDAFMVAKDATSALGWAAILVLVAKAFGVDMGGDEAQRVIEALLILWPLAVAIVSTVVRWFQDSRPKPLPSPPPSPLPPPGIRDSLPADDSFRIKSVHVSVKPNPESENSGTIFGRYDFESRPPGGGPNGPKK